LVSRVWNISSGIGPWFPLAGGLRKFYANAGGKRPIQAASQSTFIIEQFSWNDKNKQLALLSQRK
jgi:hypothetical protein